MCQADSMRRHLSLNYKPTPLSNPLTTCTGKLADKERQMNEAAAAFDSESSRMLQAGPLAPDQITANPLLILQRLFDETHRADTGVVFQYCTKPQTPNNSPQRKGALQSHASVNRQPTYARKMWRRLFRQRKKLLGRREQRSKSCRGSSSRLRRRAECER